MKYKKRGVRKLVCHDQFGKLVTYDIEVGRSMVDYRKKADEAAHRAFVKIANSHFAKNTSVILAVAFASHSIFA